MGEIVYNVSQVSEYIKKIFEAEEMLIGIKVMGEITNLKMSGRATYFDLKDDSASLPCVAFDESIMAGIKFGDKVIVKGRPNYYTKGGRLSFVVSKIEKAGLGELFQEYIRLKEKLEKEGYFDPLKKQPLPKYPKRIGVVTSRTGAVIRDIIRVAREKNRSTDIVLFPAKVQGIGAKEDIIKGIQVLDGMNLDIIIVARGGGSFEDYQPFNTEEVVMAVYNAKTPLISAIGHENDYSLIDFAADKRAGTPSIASEMAFYDEQEELDKMVLILKNALINLENTNKQALQTLNNLGSSMERSVCGKLDRFSDKINNVKAVLPSLIDNKIISHKSKIDLLATEIEKSNPLALLKRGYTMVHGKTGEQKISVSQIKQGEELEIRFIDGTASAVVNNIKEQ